jgi:molybdopterin converting factor small subunit
MQIEVRIFGELRKSVKGSEKPLTIALHRDAMVGDLLKAVSIPQERVKVIFVNGRQEKADHRLEEGDRVGIFPPSGGG